MSQHKSKLFKEKRSNPLSPEQAFGTVLRERRKALGLTQKDLEEEQLDRSYISKLELGKRQVCLRGLLHIAEMLEMPPEELVKEVVSRMQEGEEASPNSLLTNTNPKNK